MRAVKRYVIKCIAHADRTKFKTYREVENGDTYAGWSECPPIRGSDFVIRFHHKYDIHNTIKIGRVVDLFHNSTFKVAEGIQPFKFNPKYGPLPHDWRDQLGTGDMLVQTENALLIFREVAQWQ
ncbi:hypothetical protein [Caudoviricetes sp.]|nr:hypothetical protein [Caudoviricetes sp.]UOF79125.1 hypothetical protein [Caudoviricetes sp.]